MKAQATVYEPDRGPIGKVRRRLVRAYARRPAPRGPGPRGWITFSFDDAPASSVQAGAPVLERRGVRGSWFISAGLFGSRDHLGAYVTAEDVADLGRRGHEVACHTFSHLDCARMPAAAVVEDIELSRARLAELGRPPETFAYPFGEVAFGAKAALGGRFRLLRAIHPGLVRRGSDLAQAPSVGLQGPDGESTALAWTARAAAQRAWLILFTHDVQAEPTEWGCTPEALGRVADAALAAGLEVVTAAEGARRLGTDA